MLGATKDWLPVSPAQAADALEVGVTNVATLSVDPCRAHVTCQAKLHITTDGPVSVSLTGCRRTVHATN